MDGIIKDLHWYSDWNGYEVGYPDLNVVGLYTSGTLSVDVYLDTETGEVLEIMSHEEGR